MRGVFVCVQAGLPCSARVQVSLVQENIGGTVLPCTSLADLVGYRPIPEGLSRKPRPEMHFGVQARLVRHGIDSAEQIHIEETGIALIPGVDEYSFFFSAD